MLVSILTPILPHWTSKIGNFLDDLNAQYCKEGIYPLDGKAASVGQVAIEEGKRAAV